MKKHCAHACRVCMNVCRCASMHTHKPRLKSKLDVATQNKLNIVRQHSAARRGTHDFKDTLTLIRDMQTHAHEQDHRHSTTETISDTISKMVALVQILDLFREAVIETDI